MQQPKLVHLSPLTKPIRDKNIGSIVFTSAGVCARSDASFLILIGVLLSTYVRRATGLLRKYWFPLDLDLNVLGSF